MNFEFDGDDVMDKIEAVVDSFDLTIPGKDKSLGRDMAVAVALGIAEHAREGKDPDGNEWLANEPKYAAYKLAKYGAGHPGKLGGQMLSQTSLLGKPEITKDAVVMTYGWDKPPDRTTAGNGTEMRPSELKATDREKAGYFADRGCEFYAINEATAEAVVKVAEEALEKHIKAAGL